MQQSTSRKISYLQFIGALLVIAQHTVFAAYFNITEPWLLRLHTWARDMNDGAVSTFFFLSAVLLMGSIGKYTWKQIMLRKLKTIALPYLLWIVVYTAARIIRGSLAAGAVVLPSPAEMWSWIVTGPEYYIFWFLRALLGLTALYPLMVWAIRKRWPALLMLVACPLMVLVPGEGVLIPFESIIYWLPPFLLGCWAGLELPRLEKTPVLKRRWMYVAVFLLFLLTGWLRRVNTFFYYSFWTTSPLLFWPLADLFVNLPKPPWWINATFFMYCCHMLLERYAVRLYLFLFGTGRKAFVLCHVLLPLICAALVLLLAWLLRRLLPGVYSVITGLRRPDHQQRRAKKAGAAE